MKDKDREKERDRDKDRDRGRKDRDSHRRDKDRSKRSRYVNVETHSFVRWREASLVNVVYKKVSLVVVRLQFSSHFSTI